MNRISRLTFFFILAVVAYIIAAILTVSDNGFQNGTEDINMLYRGNVMVTRPSTMLQADETGRNNIASYLLLGGLFRIFGLRPFYYYAILLTLHVVVALFLALFARGILGGLTGGAVAGLFFLILGVHFQTIGWIENLCRVSMTLFSLLALMLFASFRKAPSAAKLCAVYGLWFVALNFTEEAFVFPMLVLAYDVLICRTNIFSRPFASNLFIYLPFVMIQALFFLFQFTLYGVAMRQYVTLQPHLMEKIVGIFWTLANLVVPRREALAVFMSGIPFLRVVLPFMFLAPLIYFFFRFGRPVIQERRFFSVALFSVFWFVIAFSPYVLRPLEISWKEYPHPRYLYCPMMGLSLLVGAFVQHWLKCALSLNPRSLRLAVCASMVVVGIYFYVLNVWTYCFMVEKLCAAGCRDVPADLSLSSAVVAGPEMSGNHGT